MLNQLVRVHYTHLLLYTKQVAYCAAHNKGLSLADDSHADVEAHQRVKLRAKLQVVHLERPGRSRSPPREACGLWRTENWCRREREVGYRDIVAPYLAVLSMGRPTLHACIYQVKTNSPSCLQLVWKPSNFITHSFSFDVFTPLCLTIEVK